MDRSSAKKILKRMWEKSGIEGLASREKRILFVGLVFIVCFVVIQFIVAPFLVARNNLAQSIVRKKQELVQIKELQQEYRALRQEEGTIRSRIHARESGFTLFTFLDKQAETAKVKKQIKYMKPSTSEGENELHETMVEMKLQQVSLEALVDFILLVESEKYVVFIRRMSIQESGNEQGYLDSILQIVTFEKKA